MHSIATFAPETTSSTQLAVSQSAAAANLFSDRKTISHPSSAKNRFDHPLSSQLARLDFSTEDYRGSVAAVISTRATLREVVAMESAALRCSFGRPRATSSTEATRTEAGGKLSHKQAYCVDLARWQWPNTASLRHRITLETLSAAATAALAEFRHHPKWPIFLYLVHIIAVTFIRKLSPLTDQVDYSIIFQCFSSIHACKTANARFSLSFFSDLKKICRSF